MAAMPRPCSSRRCAHRAWMAKTRFQINQFYCTYHRQIGGLNHPPLGPHRGRFFDGWRSNAIHRDRRLPVRADVFRIRTPCGRAEARPLRTRRSASLADAQKRVPTCGRAEARPYGKPPPLSPPPTPAPARGRGVGGRLVNPDVIRANKMFRPYLSCPRAVVMLRTSPKKHASAPNRNVSLITCVATSSRKAAGSLTASGSVAPARRNWF